MNVEREAGEIPNSSLPGTARRKTRVNALMTRQSIIFRKKMDARVKPGHDSSIVENPR